MFQEFIRIAQGQNHYTERGNNSSQTSHQLIKPQLKTSQGCSLLISEPLCTKGGEPKFHPYPPKAQSLLYAALQVLLSPPPTTCHPNTDSQHSSLSCSPCYTGPVLCTELTRAERSGAPAAQDRTPRQGRGAPAFTEVRRARAVPAAPTSLPAQPPRPRSSSDPPGARYEAPDQPAPSAAQRHPPVYTSLLGTRTAPAIS